MSEDIIAQVKAAESEAARIESEAAETKRRLVADAEAAAADEAARLQARLAAERRQALEQARSEAAALAARSETEARADEERVASVPPDRLGRAVARAVEEVKQRWQ